jgi:hypothetical protein
MALPRRARALLANTKRRRLVVVALICRESPAYMQREHQPQGD